MSLKQAHVYAYAKQGLQVLAWFLIVQSLAAQSKRDYVWMWGLGDEWQSNILDFGGGQLTKDSIISNLWVTSRNNIISTEEGDLALYTNDCHFMTSPTDSINLPHNVNHNKFGDIECNTRRYHPGVQGSILLPSNYDENTYTLIHESVAIYDDPVVTILPYVVNYSTVSKDGGSYVSSIDNPIHSRFFVAGYITAMLHANQKDWWIIEQEMFSNRKYSLLMDSVGVHVQDSIDIGPDLAYDAHNNGQAVFSPDGTMYAMFNDSTGLMLFDFDRSTGGLSNYRNVQTPTNYSFSGVAFSPNSRFVYLSTAYTLYQVDVDAADLQASLVVIDHWDGTVDLNQTDFCQARLGPDCKIYIAPSSFTYSLHVINNPDEPGAACNFVQRGLPLLQSTSLFSMPNFPHYRVDEDWPCDPSILTSIDHVDPSPPALLGDLLLYPNPASRFVSIDEARVGDTYMIVDMAGQVVDRGTLTQRFVTVDQLAEGVYTLVLQQDSGWRKGRFVRL